MEKNNTALVDKQEFENVLITRLKEYSLATFERSFNNEKDGLRPVTRRVLYTLYELGLTSTMKKVQYVSGAVMKYHPYNGDTIADSMVLMGQWFSTSYPYLDRQGSYGSVKNIGNYSAPRYIECRLSKFAQDCITNDIDNHCITYTDNYDNTFKEPEYLPTKVPLSLVQRSWGIGEAFVNGIPPYNLNDVVDCCIKVIRNKNIPLKELMKGVYPDYPTGGIIINKSELDYFQSLSASEVENMIKNEKKSFTIKYRGKCRINREKSTIEILELPDRVDFDTIWEKIKDEVRNKNNIILSGITNYTDRLDPDRDENMIFELICKKDANLPEILNQLYLKTQLSTSQTLSFILYCGEYLKRMSFKDIILSWYKTQYDIKRRKCNYLLSETENKLHILEGLLFVYGKMDEVIKTIRASKGTDDCINSLVKKFDLSFVQAKGISEMQLRSLSSVSKDELIKDMDKLREKIKYLEDCLINIDELIIKDLLFMKNKYGRKRRTEVTDLKEEQNSKTSINISNGSLLYSRDSIGIFDSTVLSNGKTILNSLKPVKVNGKNVKEIIGSHTVKRDVTGVIVFTKDGSARRLTVKEIPITNNWITTELENEITSAIPVYENEEDSLIIVMNDDYKIRSFKVSDIGKNKVSVGKVISSKYIDKDEINSNVLIINEYGDYLYIEQNEIPMLSRNSQGNNTGFINGDHFNIHLLNKDLNDTIMIFVKDSEGSTYCSAIDINRLVIGKRTHKPKQLLKLKNFNYCNSAMINNKIKNDSNIILIGNYSTISLKGRFIKDAMEFKKINITPINAIQI